MGVEISKLGNLWLAHSHYGLHVSLIEAWHDTIVELAALGCFILHLVDVTEFVSNRGWNEGCGLRERLYDGDHLRAHLIEALSVCEIEQAA